MSADIYTPQADSLAGRCIAYFRRLPDEELSSKDIALKFQAEQSSVQILLKRAVETGMLARDGAIYSAGPQIGQLAPPATTLAERPKQPPAKGFDNLRHHIDLTALQVEEGIPYLAQGPGPAGSKWAPIFDKLQKPGQSIAIPVAVKAALAAAAIKRNKEKNGTFKVALTSSTTARIWRIA
jgi:hypothetical protein